MNIQFDTTSTNEIETRALIALLSALLPTSNGQTQAAPSTLIEQLKASLALAGDPTPTAWAQKQAEQNMAAQAGPQLVEPEPTKRTRRTKEQIAADEAAKNASVPQTAPAETPAQAVNGALKTVSADELRALLNGYIARHSMEEAIDKLKSFGCNRVTEALALESAKLNELAATLNG